MVEGQERETDRQTETEIETETESERMGAWKRWVYTEIDRETNKSIK